MNDKPRGRPRKYDPDSALKAALEAFRQRGYSATSLDHLCEATGMKRPSLYAAFGNKQEIYLKAVEKFREHQVARQNAALFSDRPLMQSLREYFILVIESYVPENGRALGCPVMSVVVSEASTNTEIGTELASTIRHIDACFHRRLKIARAAGDISQSFDTLSLALLLASLQHSLALRARAGFSSEQLKELANQSLSCLLA